MATAPHSPRRPRHARRTAARLAWLRAWPALPQLPAADEDVTERHAAALDQAYRAMVAQGLYSPVSEPGATRWWIRRCVSALRGRPVDVPW
jgi:hypothetical protein